MAKVSISSSTARIKVSDIERAVGKSLKNSKKKFRIILTQGLNRQIRRMCEYLEYNVKKLKDGRIVFINENKQNENNCNKHFTFI